MGLLNKILGLFQNLIKKPQNTDKEEKIFPPDLAMENAILASNYPQKEDLLKAYNANEQVCQEANSVVKNLRVLKATVDMPKEAAPNLRFTKITEHLHEAEVYETIRQERWNPDVYCPKCKSNNLQRRVQFPPQPPHNYRYECLDCGNTFNDDSDTPMAGDPIPIQVWMQCWYLMGCTDSISYIAHKLHLDIATVEKMIQRLQKTFGATHPLTKFSSYSEETPQHLKLRKQLERDLQREKLDANVSTVPTDTVEFRRQQDIRRTGKRDIHH